MLRWLSTLCSRSSPSKSEPQHRNQLSSSVPIEPSVPIDVQDVCVSRVASATTAKSRSTPTTSARRPTGAYEGQSKGSHWNPTTPHGLAQSIGVDLQQCMDMLSTELDHSANLPSTMQPVDVLSLQPPLRNHLRYQREGSLLALFDKIAAEVLHVLMKATVPQEVLVAAPHNLQAARAALCAPRAESTHSSVSLVPRNTSVERWAWMATSATWSPCQSDVEDDDVDDAASVLSFEEEDVIDARLVYMFGSRETVSTAVNVFYRKCVTDKQLQAFFAGSLPNAAKRSMLSFFANALGLKPISADRMYQIHTGMVSKGLDMHLFFKVMHTFLAALASVGVRKELLELAEVNFRATQVLFEDIIERASRNLSS